MKPGQGGVWQRGDVCGRLAPCKFVLYETKSQSMRASHCARSVRARRPRQRLGQRNGPGPADVLVPDERHVEQRQGAWSASSRRSDTWPLRELRCYTQVVWACNSPRPPQRRHRSSSAAGDASAIQGASSFGSG